VAKAACPAIVLCVDEKPSIQALERAQGYSRGDAVHEVEKLDAATAPKHGSWLNLIEGFSQPTHRI
jgi:hypothetical protein